MKKRYRPRGLILPAHDEVTGDESGDTAREVIIDDGEPVATGLLDQHGNPLYRVVERIKIGFVK